VESEDDETKISTALSRRPG